MWREGLGHISRICLCPGINYPCTFYVNPKPVSKSVGNLHAVAAGASILYCGFQCTLKIGEFCMSTDSK